MKKFAALSALVLSISFALVGCAAKSDSQSEPSEPVAVGSEQGSLRWFAVELPGKKIVDCVGSYYTGSVIQTSCDWANVYSFSGDFKGDSGTLKSYTVKADDGREVLCVASYYTGSVLDPDCNWSKVSNR